MPYHPCCFEPVHCLTVLTWDFGWVTRRFTLPSIYPQVSSPYVWGLTQTFQDEDGGWSRRRVETLSAGKAGCLWSPPPGRVGHRGKDWMIRKMVGRAEQGELMEADWRLWISIPWLLCVYSKLAASLSKGWARMLSNTTVFSRELLGTRKLSKTMSQK